MALVGVRCTMIFAFGSKGFSETHVYTGSASLSNAGFKNFKPLYAARYSLCGTSCPVRMPAVCPFRARKGKRSSSPALKFQKPSSRRHPSALAWDRPRRQSSPIKQTPVSR